MRWIWLFVVFLSVMGCAKRPNTASYAYEDSDGEESYGGIKAESDRMPAPSPAMEMDAFMAEEPMDELASEASPVDQPKAQQRMVHYDGYAEIRAPRADDLLDSVEQLVLKAGGFVEARGSAHIATRVPVKAFEATWEATLGLGKVEHKRLSADDVTDAFRDTSLRLSATKAMRDRLQVLLAQASTDLERMALLKQIHRLTDEIDGMEQQVKLLSTLAAMSRLTVQASGMRNDLRQALPQGMAWIDELSPFERSQAHSWRKLGLPDATGFVRLQRSRWLAEAADGAVLQGGRQLNDPQGDGAFWIDAIATRIGEEFDDGTKVEQGEWKLLRLVEQGNDEPYVWQIAVRVQGRKLELATAFYPSVASEGRHHAAFLDALAGGGVS